MDIDDNSVILAAANIFPELIQEKIQYNRENDLKLQVYKGSLLNHYS